jgi:hypothetical protein
MEKALSEQLAPYYSAYPSSRPAVSIVVGRRSFHLETKIVDDDDGTRTLFLGLPHAYVMESRVEDVAVTLLNYIWWAPALTVGIAGRYEAALQARHPEAGRQARHAEAVAAAIAVRAVHQINYLEKLVLNSAVPPDEAERLFGAVARRNNVRALMLVFSGPPARRLPNYLANAVAGMLGPASLLAVLRMHFQDPAIPADTVVDIARALVNNRQLRSLAVPIMVDSDRAARALSDAMRSNRTLENAMIEFHNPVAEYGTDFTNKMNDRARASALPRPLPFTRK